eukprot:scaffold142864_cov23-Cyclotella_meneghiniana.AAC.1
MSNTAASPTGISRRIVIFILLLFGLAAHKTSDIILNLSRGDDNIANTDHEFINVAKGKFATQSSVLESHGLSLLDRDGVTVETREFENTCGVDTIVEEFNNGCLFEIA